MFRDRVVIAEMESSTLTQGEVRDVTSLRPCTHRGLRSSPSQSPHLTYMSLADAGR